MGAVLRAARREPSAILFAAQMAAVLLYPFMEGRSVGRPLFSVFGILILGLVLLAVRASPALTWVAVLLGAPATVLLMIQAITRSNTLVPYSSALEAVLYFYAAGALIRYMLADPPRSPAMSCGPSAPRSRSWPGRSPTRTRCARRSSPAASLPAPSRAGTGRGWSCCFSASRTSPAPASAT